MKTTVKAIAAAALMLAAALPASAQWQRTPTPNDTLQSVRLNTDGSVTYSIYAPKARTVSLAGDAMPWGAKVETREQPNGVWSITVPQVTPGVYRYHFVVDGVQVYDPKSPTTTELTASSSNCGRSGLTRGTVRQSCRRTDAPHGSVTDICESAKVHLWPWTGFCKCAKARPRLILYSCGSMLLTLGTRCQFCRPADIHLMLMAGFCRSAGAYLTFSGR